MYLSIVIILLIIIVIYLVWYLDYCYFKINDTWVSFRSKQYRARDLKIYPEVMDYLKDHKVYISMTTSPIRIDKIHKVIDSLDLTYIEKILLCIPYKFGRDNSEYKIPKWITDHPKIHIIRMETDLGPVSKILPSLEYIYKLDPDSAIISIDDDNCYPKSCVNEFIFNFVHKRCVVGSSKAIFESDLPEIPSSLEGWSGVIYPAHLGLHTEKIKTLTASCKACYLSDDFVLSYHLNKENIKFEMIEPNEYFNSLMVRPFSYYKDQFAIHQNTSKESQADDAGIYANLFGFHFGKYYNCYKTLLDSEHRPLKSKGVVS